MKIIRDSNLSVHKWSLQENSCATHLHTVTASFLQKTATELTSFDRDRMTRQAWNLYSLVLYTESLLTFVLVICNNASKECSRTHILSSLQNTLHPFHLPSCSTQMTQPSPVDITSPRSFFLTGWLKTHILHLPYFYFGIWFSIPAHLVWLMDWLIDLLFGAWFSLWFSTGQRISSTDSHQADSINLRG